MHMHVDVCHTHTHTRTHTHTHSQDPSAPVDKRAHHNALERRRRDHIKDSFYGLRDCIPAMQGEKVRETGPTATILYDFAAILCRTSFVVFVHMCECTI